MQETFADTAQDEAQFRAMQIGRYTHAYSITLRVPNDHDVGIQVGGESSSAMLKSAILQIEEDAEFHITHMTAAVMAPVAAGSEVRDASMTPLFPMAGVTTGRSDRGLAFRISEPGSGRRLVRGITTSIGPNVMAPTPTNQNSWWASQGFLALESVFPPAYGFEFSAPVAFEYHLERNKRLLVEFLNRDSDVGAIDPVGNIGLGGHRVTFAFLGQRYDT